MSVSGSPPIYASRPHPYHRTLPRLWASNREGAREVSQHRCWLISETEYQLLLARDLGYMENNSHEQLDGQVNEVKRMLNSFIQKLTAQ